MASARYRLGTRCLKVKCERALMAMVTVILAVTVKDGSRFWFSSFSYRALCVRVAARNLDMADGRFAWLLAGDASTL